MYLGHVKVLLGMFLSLKTLYRKRTVIWPFYFYTIIRTLSIKKNTNDLKKYQNIKEILKIICYGLLIIAFFYLAGHAIGKGWAYYTQ